MSLKPRNLNFYFSMCFMNLILSLVSPHLKFMRKSWRDLGAQAAAQGPLLDLFRSLSIAQPTMDTWPLKGGTQGNPGIPLQYNLWNMDMHRWQMTDGI